MKKTLLPRPASGFVMADLVVGIAIASVFMLVFGLIITRSVDIIYSSSRQATAESQIRNSTDEIVRLLRGSRPLGICKDPEIPDEDGVKQPPTSTEISARPFNACNKVSERPFSLAYDFTGGGNPWLTKYPATPSSLCFYSYKDSTVEVDTDQAPYQICLKAETDEDDGARPELILEYYKPIADATYTTPQWDTDDDPSSSRVIGTVDNVNIFSYYDSTLCELKPPYGNTLTTDDGLPDPCGNNSAQINRVSLVKFNPTFTFKGVFNKNKTFGVDFYIALYGSRFAQEATWKLS